MHTEIVSGIPSIFSQFITTLPAFHEVVVFLCVKSVPVPHVRPEERFLLGRVGPKECQLYRCIARYGYRDFHKDDTEFENDLICSIAEFMRSYCFDENASGFDSFEVDAKMTVVGTSASKLEGVRMCEERNRASSEMEGASELREVNSTKRVKKRVRFVLPESPQINMDAREELHKLMEAREAGMAFIMGRSLVCESKRRIELDKESSDKLWV